MLDWLFPDGQENTDTTSDSEIVKQVCLKILQGAAFGVSLAPIPGVAIVPKVVEGLIVLVENVQVNKEVINTMTERCRGLSGIVAEVDVTKASKEFQKSSEELSVTLCRIYKRIEPWSKYGRIRSFVLQSSVKAGISQCSDELEMYIERFKVACGVDNNIKINHANVALVGIAENQKKGQEGIENLLQNMASVQEQLGSLKTDSKEHKALAQELYNVQKKNNMLLPHFELKAGEVKRIGTQPIDGSSQFDIWEGLYLENEKVTLRVIRAAQFKEKERERILRELQIWRRLWDIDGGEYVVRFYGICFIDGPYPYIVNPYFRNGDALKYITLHPDVKRLPMIRRVAEGLRLMHSQDPPIVHGELKASKIMISDEMLPLLADFGLSKMIENATSVAFTQTNTFSSQYPWFAPEVCSETFAISTASDVYSFAMTILELMTGKQPFHYVKRPTEVLVKVRNGERPQRPTEPEVEERGLDDNLWNLLQRCWAQNPEDRPTIKDVLKELPQVSI